MNIPAHCLTARQLHDIVSRPNPSPTASAAWRLMLARNSPYAILEDFAHRMARIPETSLIELVQADQRAAENAGYHVPALELMREGIRDGLSCGPTGNGNRFRRRLDALNMGARRKMSIPAAPVTGHHLNCA